MRNSKIELSSPSKIEKVEFNIKELDRFKNTDYYKNLLFYYNTLLHKMSFENMNIFKKNIKYLDIEEKLHLFGTYGGYDMKNNKIYLLSKIYNEGNFYHELLHMSSNIYDKEKDIVYSGLSYNSKKLILGDGLNEGYTELLNRRFFGYDKEDHSYECQIVLSRLVEKIAGDDIMARLYFNADLNTLMKILQIYNSKMPVVKFIKYIDKTIESPSFIVRKYKEDFNTDYFKYITSYLITTYTNKMYLSYLKGNITEDEYLRYIDYYINSVFDIIDLKEEIRPRFKTWCVEKTIEDSYKNAKTLIRK